MYESDKPEVISEPFSLIDLVAPLSFGFIAPASSGARDSHLRGQHTVRMSPVSTARLNPQGHAFCLAPPGNSILIPILLNNTTPLSVKYSLLPLGYTENEKHGKVEYVELSVKDLKAIEQFRIDTFPTLRQPPSSQRDSDEYDEYDDDGDEDDAEDAQSTRSALQKSQSLSHIRITKPGRLRLLRVLDASNTEARIVQPVEVTIVPCPHVEFADDSDSAHGHDVHCAGQNSDLELMINMRGVPPLSLRWSKSVNGKKEHFLVEGVEGGHIHPGHSDQEIVTQKRHDREDVPQDLKIPLAVSLDTLGTHLYTLEEVVDGLGNIVPVGLDAHSPTSPSRRMSKADPKTIRSLVVLRRPTVSFKHCGPGSPTPLLIGSEAALTISAKDADTLDAPWEVTLKYQPEESSSKRTKAWKKTMKTSQDEKELSLMANAPGQYTILGVKGQVCVSYMYLIF